MSAARKALLLDAATKLHISVDHAESAAVMLLALLVEETQDGAIIIRNMAAKTEGLLVSDRKLDLRKLVDAAPRLERGETV